MNSPSSSTTATPDGAPGNSAGDSPPATGSAPRVTAVAAVGQPAPDFELTGLDGAKAKLSDHKGKIVVLEWFNPDCPYVRMSHTKGSLKGSANSWNAKDSVVWLAVNSGAPGKQGYGAETNKAGVARFGLQYPVLDFQQEICPCQPRHYVLATASHRRYLQSPTVHDSG